MAIHLELEQAPRNVDGSREVPVLEFLRLANVDDRHRRTAEQRREIAGPDLPDPAPRRIHQLLNGLAHCSAAIVLQ